MKDGLNIISAGEYIQKIDKVTPGSSNYQILNENGLEIMDFMMPIGNVGGLSPRISEGEFEVYYVASGKMEIYLPNGCVRQLNQGDFLSMSPTDQFFPYNIIEEKNLHMFSNHPQYDGVKSRVNELKQMMQQLQKADGDTNEHCKRVCALSQKIAIQMKYDFSKMKNLFYAAVFHDVGKSKIPLDVLIKPGKLTSAEYEIMKEHVVHSADMIKSYFGDDIVRIVLEHHERMDGSGYPYGIKGEQIHMGARIIAVADSYDAMVTDRPYHMGISKEKAIEELKKCSGRLFDEKVVNAFVHYLNENE